MEKKNYFENKIEKCTRICIAGPRLRKLILTEINEKMPYNPYLHFFKISRGKIKYLLGLNNSV